MGCVSLGRKSVLGSVWKVSLDREFSSGDDPIAFVRDLVVSRGFDPSQVDAFLSPLIKRLMPDPFGFSHMDKAVARVLRAIDDNEHISVFADYDVDGITSSSVLHNYLHELGVNSEIYIPNRIDEGYGPNIAAMSQLKEKGVSLCITVDCGISAHEPLEFAFSLGLDVIIIDHHMGSDVLPEVLAIVNPNKAGRTEYGYMAAVGIVFLFVVALNKKLREAGAFATKKEPNLMSLLDIVAIGTICDMVPLIGINRAFVSRGLKLIGCTENLGLKSLIEALGLGDIGVYDIGFKIGPCINACGRIGDPTLGSELLTSSDREKCEDIASQLCELNEERKRMNDIGLSEAMLQAEKQVLEGHKFIFVSGDWHPGIIGILAGRIKDSFYLPVVVVSVYGEGSAKASARSVPGIDIGSLVLEAKNKGLVIEGGGHVAAAGFAMHVSDIEVVHNFMTERTCDVKIERFTDFDAYIDISALNTSFVEHLNRMGPFGIANASPRFVIKNPEINKVKKGKVLNCRISSGSHSVAGVCFNEKIIPFLEPGLVFDQLLVSLSKRRSVFSEISLVIEDMMI